MNKRDNINFKKVEEMAEGDADFQAELLQAIYTSIQDLKSKYIEGLSTRNEDTLQQARHKIKPTLSLFELKRIHTVLLEGKTIVSSKGFEALADHEARFLKAAEDLLEDLQEVMK